MSEAALRTLRDEMRAELIERILPFWTGEAADARHGGIVGFVSEDGHRDDEAPKGCILHARLLWTLSAASRALGDESYRAAADRIAAYFSEHFVDPVFGGVFWMVDARGRPLDERKHVYAQAFAIYALAEHFRASADAGSLAAAIAIYRLVEAHARDTQLGGYEEAFSRSWALLDDVRLSDVDANERRSMNTHLHLLEAYTTLYIAWPDASLRPRLESLIELFLDRIIAPDGGHVVGFLTTDWQPRSTRISFGHDIETSWLLMDAALALGNAALTSRVNAAARRLSEAVLADGLDRECGGIFYARDAGRLDMDKEWWPQVEAIVGFLAAFQESERPEFLDAAVSAWGFARDHLLDRRRGEWLRRVSRDGTESRGGEKVGPWKCPYHNGRACLEVMSRVDSLIAASEGPRRA
jgi:mannobiose 2-epimerase